MEFLLNYLWLLHFIFVDSGGKSVSAVTQPGGAPIFTLVNKHQLRDTLKGQRQGSRCEVKSSSFHDSLWNLQPVRCHAWLQAPLGEREEQTKRAGRSLSAQRLWGPRSPGLLEDIPALGSIPFWL